MLKTELKKEVIRKDNKERIIKQRSKVTFNSIQKHFTIYDGYTFKQNEVIVDKPIYLGFAALELRELSKLLIYETYCDKLQRYFGGEINNHTIWVLIV